MEERYKIQKRKPIFFFSGAECVRVRPLLCIFALINAANVSDTNNMHPDHNNFLFMTLLGNIPENATERSKPAQRKEFY